MLNEIEWIEVCLECTSHRHTSNEMELDDVEDDFIYTLIELFNFKQIDVFQKLKFLIYKM